MPARFSADDVNLRHKTVYASGHKWSLSPNQRRTHGTLSSQKKGVPKHAPSLHQ
jgi:hypothetical protein